MRKWLVSLNDLPPDGREFTLDDQQIWLEPLKEFKMDCRISAPLAAKIRVSPAEDGCLVRGSLAGAVVLPCNRCAEDAPVNIESRFEEFEEVPADEVSRGDSPIVFEQHSPMLDLAAVAWEEFMLSLPVNPLCRPDCKGLCPQCGANLNAAPCSCQLDEADPRMAPLRDFVIKRQ